MTTDDGRTTGYTRGHSFDHLTGRQNIAVNLWYSPLWDKDFPCRRCRPRLSPRYRDALARHGL